MKIKYEHVWFKAMNHMKHQYKSEKQKTETKNMETCHFRKL